MALKGGNTLKYLAVAMINSSVYGYSNCVLEVKDIKILSKRDG
jgi:hypothetical protein